MNLKWLKQNLLVVGFSIVFLIMLGIGLWYQQLTATRKSDIEGQLTNKQEELKNLTGRKPFPSQQNVESLRTQRREMERLYATLTNAAARAVVPVPDMTPFSFSQLLAKTLAQMQAATSNGMVRTPESFAFSFSRYLNRLPCSKLSDTDCKQKLRQLCKQLVVTEKLTELLITNRVEEIRAFRRAEIETGESAPDTFEMPPAPPKNSNALFTSLPFELQITCNTESLRGFLDDLTSSEYFLAVRGLTVESQIVEDRGGTHSVQPATPGGYSGFAPPPFPTGFNPAGVPPQPAPVIIGHPGHRTSPPIPFPTSPSSPVAPVMMQPEKPKMRTRLLVTLRIELVEFLPVQPKVGSTAPTR